MSAESDVNRNFSKWPLAAAVVVAVGLTFVFWAPLYRGAGFVGGDVYAYYLPQKDLFVQQVHSGELPVWNHRTGYGYPTIAESQTGVLYPLTWLFYLPLDLNTAYSANHLAHYVLAFLFTWGFARKLGLRTIPAMVAAVVYVYGWFPPRCSLEWAIIGGTWLPAALWAVESFLTSRTRSALASLAVVLALQLLAGHFSIAFITLLTLAVYVPLRLWFVRTDQPREPPEGVRRTAWLVLPVAGAFVLAAVQIWPTWELKTSSQRAQVTAEHNPEYGHMPPMYITQLVASWWYWYAEDVDTDQALRGMTFLASDAMTNKVEAHLFFGSLPLMLIVISVVRGFLFRRNIECAWAIVGIVFLLYTPAWFVPLTKHLPGFNFFKGPARYGITTTLAAAVVAGFALNRFVVRRRVAGHVVGIVVLVVTVAEMSVVASQVAVAPMVDTPPIAFRDQSPFTKWLTEQSPDVRLWAPGPNLPNLCGGAAMPVYLGLSPSEYYTPRQMMPKSEAYPSKWQIDWMVRAGITHVLSQTPFSTDRLTLVLEEADSFLNAAWGRRRDMPLYLYAVSGARPRAYAEHGTARIVEHGTNRVVLDVDVSEESEVVLTDLAYPGWEAWVDGQFRDTSNPLAKLEMNPVPEDMFRRVTVSPGKHRVAWLYRPRSLYFGAAVSALAWLGLLVGVVRGRRKSANEQKVMSS